jgi:methylenetetrahydrofolate dehydrogenase (NADP+)/methenyltetrahydrofolate cyclohydrolase
MKLLNGREVAEFIQERHIREVRGLGHRRPELVIIRTGEDEATSKYLRVKKAYGEAIGIQVTIQNVTSETILTNITAAAEHATGIIVQLPLVDPDQTDAALAAVPRACDVDGLAPGSPFEAATPKAITWLLAAYNVELKDRIIAVVGQGRLVGRPLADRLEDSGYTVRRLDVDTANLASQLESSDIIITATGQAGLITSSMIAPGAVVIDAGSPQPELSADALQRTDITRTPNPGGVGPMTVAALYDNLLIAARQ